MGLDTVLKASKISNPTKTRSIHKTACTYNPSLADAPFLPSPKSGKGQEKSGGFRHLAQSIRAHAAIEIIAAVLA